jgi:uncharacterized membrane protein
VVEAKLLTYGACCPKLRQPGLGIKMQCIWRSKRLRYASMLAWRIVVLFIHVSAVIVALGGSLFSTFALTPILTAELAPPERLRVGRRVVRRLGAIVLTALAILVITGILNVLFIGAVSALLATKLVLVAIVIVLAMYQHANLGARIWQLSADGPNPAILPLQERFRRVGLTVGILVLLIVYLSLGLTRTGNVAVVAMVGRFRQ